MRGAQKQQDSLFSYVPLEKRIPKNHPLRPIRKMVDEALERGRWRASFHSRQPSTVHRENRGALDQRNIEVEYG